MSIELAIGVAAIAGLIWWARKPREAETPHVCVFTPRLRWTDWRRRTFEQVDACSCGRTREG